ncbi:hypothetical protein D3C73_1096830 [compost metagenome]
MLLEVVFGCEQNITVLLISKIVIEEVIDVDSLLLHRIRLGCDVNLCGGIRFGHEVGERAGILHLLYLVELVSLLQILPECGAAPHVHLMSV